MKYLLIQNQGLIDPFDLVMMGGSTKREDETKIGFFGSGNKYAIATLLRFKIPFRIFTGTDEIEVHTEQVTRRNVTFDKIYLMFKGERIDTSLTVQMGPQWEPWFSIREVYCNAVDEGAHHVIPMISDISGSEDCTRFYIGITPEIEPVISNWDRYFSSDRIDLYEDLGKVKVFFRRENGLRIYRKGILVHEDMEIHSLFDYDINDVSINENRVLSSVYEARYTLEREVGKHASSDLIRRILFGMHIAEIEKKSLFEIDFDFEYHINANQKNWQDATKGLTLINRSVAGNYMEQQVGDHYLLLKSSLIKAIGDRSDAEITTFGVPRKGVVPYRDYEASADELITLNKAVQFLSKAGYDCEGVEIKIVQFDNAAMFGATDGMKTIFIGHIALEHGVRKVAMVILEEYFHIESKFQDETRSFQNFILSKMLNEIEKRTGQFL